MDEPNIEDLKSQLQGLKSRADILVAKKEGLIRLAAQNEEQQSQALRELADLGHPEAADLDLQGLADLSSKLTKQLVDGLAALESAVASTEQLLGVAKASSVDSLDL